MMSSKPVLRIGTRNSPLALAQTRLVIEQLLSANPGLAGCIEIIPIVTSGDRITKGSLAEVGGKGLFTKELEKALIAHQIDGAVHSMKDVDSQSSDNDALVIDGFLPRAAVEDVVVTPSGLSWHELPLGAKVGTISPRRTAQLLSVRPDLKIVPLRGNINTRLSKLKDGDLEDLKLDAIVLARAGLQRLGLTSIRYCILQGLEFLPAPAQGVIGIQRRTEDAVMAAYLQSINDIPTSTCVRAERAVLQSLGGNCHTPIGVLATIIEDPLKNPPTDPKSDRALAQHTLAEQRPESSQTEDLSSPDDRNICELSSQLHPISANYPGIIRIEARLYSPQTQSFWHEEASGPLTQSEALGHSIGKKLRSLCDNPNILEPLRHP